MAIVCNSVSEALTIHKTKRVYVWWCLFLYKIIMSFVMLLSYDACDVVIV